MPNVPTFAEAGFPALRAPSWFRIFVRSGTPAAITAKLNRDIAAAAKKPEMLSLFDQLGYVPIGDSPESLAHRVKETKELWAPIIESTGMKLD